MIIMCAMNFFLAVQLIVQGYGTTRVVPESQGYVQICAECVNGDNYPSTNVAYSIMARLLPNERISKYQ